MSQFFPSSGLQTQVWSCWISLQSKELSRVFSNTTVQKHQLFCSQISLWSSVDQAFFFFIFWANSEKLSWKQTLNRVKLTFISRPINSQHSNFLPKRHSLKLPRFHYKFISYSLAYCLQYIVSLHVFEP